MAYTATTSNNTNTITATPTDSNAQMEILVNGSTVHNGTSVTWGDGANQVVVKVINGMERGEYTVEVDKS